MNCKIVIVTGQHMVANPRVWKEANSLTKYGYRVKILTTIYDKEKYHEDLKLLAEGVEYKAAINLIKNEGSFNDVIISRMKRRLAIVLKKYLNFDTSNLLTYSLSKQVTEAIKENADLYICHQETGLIVGNELIRLGKRVAFDIEDWYSQDYLNKLRPQRYLARLEKNAIMKGAYCTCPSKSMGKALMDTYNSCNLLVPIYNSFPNDGLKLRKETEKIPSFIWFSQVIGHGRGLESIMEVFSKVEKSFELHLYGKSEKPFRELLYELIGTDKKECLFIHSLLTHNELVKIIPKHSYGLAIEDNQPQSRDLTITNKMLQYLEAGISVFATDTTGQREVKSAMPAAVILLPLSDKPQWHTIIMDNMDIKWQLHSADAGNSLFSWQNCEKILTDVVNEAVQK